MGDSYPQRTGTATELALLLVLATLWGASYTFIRVGVATIPPITLIACRTLIAGVLLLAVMHWRGVRMPVDGATWRRLLLQACLNSVMPWTMVAWGSRTLDAGVATILNSTAPIFTFFLTLAVTRHEALTSRKLLGVAAGMAGICLIVGVQALSGFGEETTAQLAMVLAAVAYAGAAILGRSFRDLDPMVPAAGSLLCGAAILIPVSLVLERPWTLQPSASSILALLGLAVFSTALALRDLFPPDPDPGIGRHHGAGLFARADRRRGRRDFPRRAVEFDRLDRPCLCRRRCRRDDDPGAEGGRRGRVTACPPDRRGAGIQAGPFIVPGMFPKPRNTSYIAPDRSRPRPP